MNVKVFWVGGRRPAGLASCRLRAVATGSKLMWRLAGGSTATLGRLLRARRTIVAHCRRYRSIQSGVGADVVCRLPPRSRPSERRVDSTSRRRRSRVDGSTEWRRALHSHGSRLVLAAAAPQAQRRGRGPADDRPQGGGRGAIALPKGAVLHADLRYVTNGHPRQILDSKRAARRRPRESRRQQHAAQTGWRRPWRSRVPQ